MWSRKRLWSGSLTSFLHLQSLRMSRFRLCGPSLWWTGGRCRLCRFPVRICRGGDGDGRNSLLRHSAKGRAIRHTILRTIRCTNHRTIRCGTKDSNTTGRSSPRNSRSTKGRSAKASTTRRSTKGWLPSRWNCRTDGSSASRQGRTKAGRRSKRRTRCRKDIPRWCCRRC